MITPTVSEIQGYVCKRYGIPDIAMKSDQRSPKWSHPRQEAMYLASELTTLSLPALGSLFGGRDHSTVIHAIRTVRKRMAADSNYEATVTASKPILQAMAEARYAAEVERAEARRETLRERDDVAVMKIARADRTDKAAKVEGCRRLLEAHLRTGQHWLRDPAEVRRLLAA